MIAPVNCNPYCDCAQRMVRCMKAPPLHRLDPWRAASAKIVERSADVSHIIEKVEAEKATIVDIDFDAVEARYRLLRDRVVNAFRASEFDLADWDDDILGELADIAIAALEVA